MNINDLKILIQKDIYLGYGIILSFYTRDLTHAHEHMHTCTTFYSHVESFRELAIIPSLYYVLLALGFSLMLVLSVYK